MTDGHDDVSLKDELVATLELDRDRRDGGARCPKCGSRSFSRPTADGFVFCRKCHRRMPWIVFPTDNKPLTPL